MDFTEFRQKLGHIKKLEDLELYYKNIIETRPFTLKQMQIIQDIYERRKFSLEHKELPKRGKR